MALVHVDLTILHLSGSAWTAVCSNARRRCKLVRPSKITFCSAHECKRTCSEYRDRGMWLARETMVFLWTSTSRLTRAWGENIGRTSEDSTVAPVHVLSVDVGISIQMDDRWEKKNKDYLVLAVCL